MKVTSDMERQLPFDKFDIVFFQTKAHNHRVYFTVYLGYTAVPFLSLFQSLARLAAGRGYVPNLPARRRAISLMNTSISVSIH